MSIGERIKYLRKELKLSQKEFGKRIGITKSSVSLYEKNSVQPPEQSLKSICREFHVNYDWLVHGVGEMFISTEKTILDQLANEYEISDKKKELIERILSFNDDEIKAFEKMGFLILKL